MGSVVPDVPDDDSKPADDDTELSREDTKGTRLTVDADGHITASWIKRDARYVVRLPVCRTFVVGPTEEVGIIDFVEEYAGNEVIVRQVAEAAL